MDSHSSVAEAQGSLGSQIHNPDNVAFTSESSGVFISSTLELSREASAGCVARYTRNCPVAQPDKKEGEAALSRSPQPNSNEAHQRPDSGHKHNRQTVQ